MKYAALAVLSGFQSLWFGIMTKYFAVNEGLLPQDKTVEIFEKGFSLEAGLGAGSLRTGFGGAIYTFVIW